MRSCGITSSSRSNANIAGGMTPRRARTAALRAIGGIEQRKEECRDTRGISIDRKPAARSADGVRQLRKQPGFTFTAIVSLALGIGANTAIFQLLNALSLRTLPVRAPHELVEMRLTGDGRAGRHTGRNRQISLPQYEELLTRQQAFSSMLAFGDTRFNLSPTGRSALRRWPVGVGQFLRHARRHAGDRAADRTRGRRAKGCGAGVAVISYALWQSQFGGRADIIGQTFPGPGDAGADHRRDVAGVFRRRGRPAIRRRDAESARRAIRDAITGGSRRSAG